MHCFELHCWLTFTTYINLLSVCVSVPACANLPYVCICMTIQTVIMYLWDYPSRSACMHHYAHETFNDKARVSNHSPVAVTPSLAKKLWIRVSFGATLPQLTPGQKERDITRRASRTTLQAATPCRRTWWAQRNRRLPKRGLAIQKHHVRGANRCLLERRDVKTITAQQWSWKKCSHRNTLTNRELYPKLTAAPMNTQCVPKLQVRFENLRLDNCIAMVIKIMFASQHVDESWTVPKTYSCTNEHSVRTKTVASHRSQAIASAHSTETCRERFHLTHALPSENKLAAETLDIVVFGGSVLDHDTKLKASMRT